MPRGGAPRGLAGLARRVDVHHTRVIGRLGAGAQTCSVRRDDDGLDDDGLIEVKPLVVEVNTETLQTRLAERQDDWRVVSLLTPKTKEWITMELDEQATRIMKKTA